MAVTQTGAIVANLSAVFGKTFDLAYSDLEKEAWGGTVHETPATEVKSNTLRFPFFEVPDMPTYLEELEKVEEGGATDYYMDVAFRKFGRKVVWSGELEQDLPDAEIHLRSRAQETANGYPERLEQWRTSIMTGSAVVSGLPPIDVTAYDGNDIYSSSTRWQTSGGNIITGKGPTGSNIRENFFEVVRRAVAFKHDNTGSPLIPTAGKESWLIEFSEALWDAMTEAFMLELVAQGGAGTQAVANVALEFQKTFGAKVKLRLNPYLSGNDWRAHITSLPLRKPFVYAKRFDMKQYEINPANDTWARDHYANGMVTYLRGGMSGLHPFTTFLVDN